MLFSFVYFFSFHFCFCFPPGVYVSTIFVLFYCMIVDIYIDFSSVVCVV